MSQKTANLEALLDSRATANLIHLVVVEDNKWRTTLIRKIPIRNINNSPTRSENIQEKV